MRLRIFLLIIFTGLVLGFNALWGIGGESYQTSTTRDGIHTTSTTINLPAKINSTIPFQVNGKSYYHFHMQTPSNLLIFNWFIMTSYKYGLESHDLFAVDPVGSDVIVGGIDVIDCTIEFEIAANSYYLVLLNNGTGPISIDYEFSNMGTFPWKTILEFKGTDQAAKVGYLKVEEVQLFKTTFSYTANRTFEYETLDNSNYLRKYQGRSYSSIDSGNSMSINGQVPFGATALWILMDFQAAAPLLYECSIIHDYDTSGIILLVIVGIIIGTAAIFHLYLKKRRNVGLIPYLKQKLKKGRPQEAIPQEPKDLPSNSQK